MKSRRRSRKKKTVWNPLTQFFVATLCVALLLAIGYHYRNGLAYYFSFKTDKVLKNKETKQLSGVRNFNVLSVYQDKAVGIDVSEYQGEIDWKQVRFVENNFPIHFAFIRATVGKDKVDHQFETNWKAANENLIRGAYHYYRPNENSLKQAELFIRNVKLKPGDLPPVLDIEVVPREQSMDRLKVGLKRWLQKVTLHYKTKPIIYTNEKFYEAFLKEEFGEYPFWIANYNFFVEEMQDDWLLWQFTEKGTVSGIDGNVDVNLFNGTPEMLQHLAASRN